MSVKQKYGTLALIAGGSEGLGAEFAQYLAAQGIDLVLIARRKAQLDKTAAEIEKIHKVNVTRIQCDLSDNDAVHQIRQQLGVREINIFVYNAGMSFIGRFENDTLEHHNQIAQTNMITPLNLLQIFGMPMLKKGKGAIILMGSLAGFQGSGFVSTYAATKAFNRVLAESLWYEWKEKGVDVIACCAGATATPNFINTNPGDTQFFAPRVQQPEEVVKECFKKLGKTPSFISGSGNKIANFIMHRLLPRKMVINIMGDSIRKLYGL